MGKHAAAPPTAIVSPSDQIGQLLARGQWHHQAGQLAEAENYYRKVLAIDPNDFDGLHLLGVVAQQVGRSALAARLISQAIASHDRSSACRDLRGPSNGARAQQDLAAAHSNLSIVLTSLGDQAAALKAIQRSLQLYETDNAKLLFVGCLRNLSFIPDGIELRDDLARALSEPWGRPTDIACFAANLIKRNGTIGACIRRIGATWPNLSASHELFSPTELAEICGDRLLRCFLESTIVFDLELEQFLTAVRRTMLAAVVADGDLQPSAQEGLRFLCALAQQCFINEYIFFCPDEEKRQADGLRCKLVEALTSGAAVPEPRLGVVAAYFPLASLSEADLLFKRRFSAPVAELVNRQVGEVQGERRLRGSIPRLTAIDDGVSLAVKEQYEESPYPRWIKASPVVQTTIEAHLRHLFPLVDVQNVVGTKGAEILIAGCGTGQHSIETARQFPGSRVLAIDLSLSSLCYAKRKTRELGLKNVEYAQADILKLQSIDRSFDVIEAGGVLHHLAEPFAGWRVLLSILRPGGLMRLGLYSRRGRQDITAARAFIAERGYGSSANDIRRCREELTRLRLVKVAERLDFFTTSSCRDLLFHVREHQCTLPEIDEFIRQNQLDFLGFHLPGSVLQNFRGRFPTDRTMTNLALWHDFEMENPSTFAGMYQFWVRKAK